MRIIFYFIGVCLIFFSCKKESPEFVPVMILETGLDQRINDITTTSNGRWIVGAGSRNDTGYILRSDDEGGTWTHIMMDKPSSVYCVEFLDSLNGMAGGDFLHLWKTIDGGDSWQYYWLGDQVPFNEEDRPCVRDFQFWNDSTWYFCGGENLGEGVAYETQDAGQHWNFIFRQHEMRSIIRSENQLLVAGHGYVARSSGHVNELMMTDFANDFIMDMCKTSTDKIIAVSSQGAMLSTTGGESWELIRKKEKIYGENLSFTSVAAHESRIIAVGTSGLFGLSEDNGTTWKYGRFLTHPDFCSVAWLDGKPYAGTENGQLWQLLGE